MSGLALPKWVAVPLGIVYGISHPFKALGLLWRAIIRADKSKVQKMTSEWLRESEVLYGEA